LTDRIVGRTHERAPEGSGGAAFFVALDCPVSYLVAERVERDLGEIAWIPTLSTGHGGDRAAAERQARRRLSGAREEARLRRLPLLEPDNFPFDARPATRAAVYAASHGAAVGAGFTLAALRMAFAGGFDLSDPDILAEAAAAAGMPVDDTLAAAADPSHDAALELTTSALARRGILEPPVMHICGCWFPGFEALAETSAFTAARASYQALSADQA
jgi:2-hydroxychromene-2-carboxylate isomerase